MSNINVQQRKFVVKAGMTAEDVKKSKEATALQKKYASAFDTDGTKGFSQKEADLFNATTFSEKADGSVTFWTRQKDGTKKGTKFDSKDNNIQFKSEDEVKPYIKQVKVKKAAPKKEESVSFFDEAWTGHQIAKITGDNAVTDWLQNKDKVCTDGKDDGKLSIGQYALSLAKGLIGGIPKAIINHPVATAVTVGVTAAAVAVTSAAILPVLGAAGVVMGVGMAGYGAYKALTAKTDGEAKQALETCGTGMTTAVLSVLSAGKTLEKAAEAGVKSAQVSEDAGIIDKTVQMFKAIPESLTKSKEWARFKLDLPAMKEFDESGKLVKTHFSDDSYKEYEYADKLFKKRQLGENSRYLSKSRTPSGTNRKYVLEHCRYDSQKEDYSVLSSEVFENGDRKEYIHAWYSDHYSKDRAILYKEYKADGTVIEYYHTDDMLYSAGVKEITKSDGTTIRKSFDGTLTIITDSEGNTKYINTGTFESGELILAKDGTYKCYCDGRLVEETFPDNSIKSVYMKKGIFYLPDGSVNYYRRDGSVLAYRPNNVLIEYNPDGTRKSVGTWEAVSSTDIFGLVRQIRVANP